MSHVPRSSGLSLIGRNHNPQSRGNSKRLDRRLDNLCNREQLFGRAIKSRGKLFGGNFGEHVVAPVLADSVYAYSNARKASFKRWIDRISAEALGLLATPLLSDDGIGYHWGSYVAAESFGGTDVGATGKLWPSKAFELRGDAACTPFSNSPGGQRNTRFFDIPRESGRPMVS
jgi:hypothetical protein